MGLEVSKGVLAQRVQPRIPPSCLLQKWWCTLCWSVVQSQSLSSWLRGCCLHSRGACWLIWPVTARPEVLWAGAVNPTGAGWDMRRNVLVFYSSKLTEVRNCSNARTNVTSCGWFFFRTFAAWQGGALMDRLGINLMALHCTWVWDGKNTTWLLLIGGN